MTKHSVISALERMGLAPNKRYGQNFLIDENIAKKIITAASCSGMAVMEIGPGLGSLTEFLVDITSSLTAVEIDSGFCRFLDDRFADSINLIHGDILKIDFPEVPCIVANLPYYCSSEIIFMIAGKTRTETAVVMVQREMAQRLLAKHEDPSYGAPAASLWIDMQGEILFDIPPKAFYPEPDVVSSVICLKRINRDIDRNVRETYHSIIRAGFWARRKRLITCLVKSPFFSIEKERAAELTSYIGLSEDVRAEELSPEDFLKASLFLNGKK